MAQREFFFLSIMGGNGIRKRHAYHHQHHQLPRMGENSFKEERGIRRPRFVLPCFFFCI